MNRRELLLTSAALTATAAFGRFADAAPAPATTRAAAKMPEDVVWHDVRDWGVEGRAFSDTEAYFDRLPSRAKGVVRDPVWNLSRDTTGMSVRFETDATDIYLRYGLTKPLSLAMAHMPATGVSGMDLYAHEESRWQYAGTVQPYSGSVLAPIGKRLAPPASGKRPYQINLPLYNGVQSMEIGVSKSAGFAGIAPRKEKPILFYGTSITQGGCASRPGMAFTHILGRRLNVPMLNFGFSGNGRTETEVAQFLAEVDAAVFVLDCMANMGVLDATGMTVAVVKLLREKRPEMPILILDQRLPAAASVVPHEREDHQRKTAEVRKAFDDLQAGGVKNLSFGPEKNPIGDDGEGTVDGSHPTDLGMMRYAEILEPELRKLL